MSGSVNTTFSDTELLNDWIKLKETTSDTIISCHKREGMKILEHYQPHIWEVENPDGVSISKNWSNPELIKKATERTSKHYTKIYKTEIRRNLAFFGKAPLPTMYRPLLTKAIVKKYNAKQILDPSVGWGGRLIGSLANDGTHFTGIEPYTKTYKGLFDMSKFLNISDRTTLFMLGAEDVLPTLQSESFDLVITSPPYFDLEVYSHEETQSVKRFNNWSDWVDKFLDPVIKDCLRCLKPGGVSCWSVKNMSKYKLKDEVFKIHQKYKYELIETCGMSATPRNTGGKAKITEETFIFKRQG